MIRSRLTAGCTVLAAVIWLIGIPFEALGGVIPSDASYFWEGIVWSLLGLSLLPLMLVLGWPALGRVSGWLRAGGVATSAALMLSGGLSMLAANGSLGAIALSWVRATSPAPVAVLFAWIGLASYWQRGPSLLQRSLLWISMLAGAGLLLLLAASILVPRLTSGFTETDLTILPDSIVAIVVWLSLSAWLGLVAIRLWSSKLP